ncbi:hypothetical protein HA520_02125 [Azotobacter chroococcum]|uniref:Uncharacterized protein n=1 Tax=Azotobacter chroococcum TaxID=353 RepID=A0AA43Z4H2_9GAMM|nr:hypothetical protein [Azotobacter chroococcum]NHN76096.1 hypothetical protein [Azotobacter chroococcum]TBW11909.1 hypothetical protein E0E50_06990 [Azotobacter chroococcum subsp. isscasi]
MRPEHPLQLALGLVVWSLWLVAVYAGLSLGCLLARPGDGLGPATWLNGLLGLFTLFTAAWLFGCAWRLWRAPPPALAARRFVVRVGAAVHLLAGAATLFVGLPILALPPCL